MQLKVTWQILDPLRQLGKRLLYPLRERFSLFSSSIEQRHYTTSEPCKLDILQGVFIVSEVIISGQAICTWWINVKIIIVNRNRMTELAGPGTIKDVCSPPNSVTVLSSCTISKQGFGNVQVHSHQNTKPDSRVGE